MLTVMKKANSIIPRLIIVFSQKRRKTYYSILNALALLSVILQNEGHKILLDNTVAQELIQSILIKKLNQSKCRCSFCF